MGRIFCSSVASLQRQRLSEGTKLINDDKRSYTIKLYTFSIDGYWLQMIYESHEFPGNIIVNKINEQSTILDT